MNATQTTPTTATILVTGASGTIGSHLVRELQAAKANFRVMTSKAESVAAYQAKGIDAVQGDFADAASLATAFAGVNTLFLLLPLVPNKLELAATAVNAAKAAGVQHIVRSSGAGADANSPISLARLQGSIDALVAGSGIAHTFLRPNGFMQNFVTYTAGQIQAGEFYAPHEDAAQSLVDARDIASAAAVVLQNPSAHAGQAYTLTGPQALTEAQYAQALADVAGHPVRYVNVPMQAAEDTMKSWGMPAVIVDWMMSLHTVVRNGWAAGVSEDFKRLTGRDPIAFSQFAADHAKAFTKA
jgi:uncharacterized protein YbjT (DUF2867 family)